MYIKFPPVCRRGYLCVQNGFVRPYVLALFLPDFRLDGRIILCPCIIKHIKIDGMAFALRFRQDAVFPLFLAFNGCVVLRHAFQHIHTLADVNNGIVDLDAVNSCMVVFGGKPFSFQPVIDIFFIACFSQNSNSPKGMSGYSGMTAPKSYLNAPATFSAATNTSGKRV